MLIFRNLRSLAFPQKFSHLFTWAKWRSRSLEYRSSQSLWPIVKMRNQCPELEWAPNVCKNNSMDLVARKNPNRRLFAIYIHIYIYMEVIMGERDLRSVCPTGTSWMLRNNPTIGALSVRRRHTFGCRPFMQVSAKLCFSKHTRKCRFCKQGGWVGKA